MYARVPLQIVATAFYFMLFSSSLLGQSSNESSSSARDAMAEVFNQYNICDEYYDTGKLKASFLNDVGESWLAFQFSTRFQRNEFFVFKSDAPAPYSVRFEKGMLHREKFNRFDSEKGDSGLWPALRHISRETKGASTYVPSLLLNEDALATWLEKPSHWSQADAGHEDERHLSRYEFSTTSWVYSFCVDRRRKHIVQIVKTGKRVPLKIEITYEPVLSKNLNHSDCR